MRAVLKFFIILEVAVLCCAQIVTPEMRKLIHEIFNVTEFISTTAAVDTDQPIWGIADDDRGHNSSSEYKPCGYQKECVPRFLCYNDTVITNGETLIDIRIAQHEACSYLETCCEIRHKVKEPLFSREQKSRNISCGFRNANGVLFRITGDSDNEAQFGEFPWMVAILSDEDNADADAQAQYKCGGALITDRVVLTVAHCVQPLNAGSLLARAGEWDTSSTSEALPYQDRRVLEIIIHENYNKASLYNDIAVVILQSPFGWEDHIRPVCLPPPNANFDYSRCYASGWGRDKFGRNSTYQVILKKVELPVVPHRQCERNLRGTRMGGYFQLHESFLCAGGEPNRDTCNGDGGSPLVCPARDATEQYYQVGIVSWGIGCGLANIPGVYTNVAHLRPWIDKTLTSRNINLSDFQLKNIE